MHSQLSINVYDLEIIKIWNKRGKITHSQMGMVCSLYLINSEGHLEPEGTLKTGLADWDSLGHQSAPNSSLGASCRGNLKPRWWMPLLQKQDVVKGRKDTELSGSPGWQGSVEWPPQPALHPRLQFCQVQFIESHTLLRAMVLSLIFTL